MHTEDHETVFAFDTDRDKLADFWQYQRPGGRKHAIAYAADVPGRPGERIELDAIAAAECPHFIIVLDGVPFEIVAELYHAGHFRFFHPPTRVVCCYPAMTDLALSELFHTERCRAYQALYFERDTKRLSDGSAVYLHGGNSPWLAKMSYRCSLWWDVLVYLDPRAVFNHEMKGILRTFREIDAGEGHAYSVGTAGLGTRGGRAAIVEYLRTVDRLCEQLVFERRGRVNITLTADHGHNLVENRRIKFDEVLKAGGYRPSKSLRSPRDVVAIAYGLVTYAALYTADPPGVAQCLLGHDDVEFACYRHEDALVVADRHGQARITKGDAGFGYDSSAGDPLRLAPIIERLRRDGHVSAAGEIDGPALFAATLDHDYPDPLARLWSAFHGLVANPPDVIVNLRDGACHGSGFFHTMIRKVGSTHGSLNRASSTTFVLTMLGELPPALRTREVLPALAARRNGTGHPRP
ncbi:MAG: hypothetical protein KAW41_06920 [Candidatus Diapherotrites archaeon]|nr:hypothetical protein [Candidatus Diapherotrites archaeon]